MIVTIPELLDSSALSKISDWMEQAEWISGAHTAGRNAVHHKSNREMDQQSEQWKKINSLVVST
nr:hypothetical protein [Gammaproteobacteria bacterium]